MTDIGRIRQAQTETADAFSRLLRKGSLSFSGLKNPAAQLRRLEVGGALSAGELLNIARMLAIAKRAKGYGRQEREDLPVDSLQGMFDGIESLTSLHTEITRCILSEDEIADNASPGLSKIRRSMKSTAERVHTSLNQIINSQAGRTYLQDALITMRHGRYCVPVKSEYKAKVPGMVHDQSASGSTLFIEPMAVVKLNNELREAALKEQEEIEKILASLSEQTAEQAAYLEADFKILKDLDFIFAKAKLARDQNAMMPEFNTEGIIRLRKARHPLLDPKRVVPIDIRLGEEFNTLIVTGPNTGGKTVSLKTVGLLTLMGQAGLHIPGADRCQLAVFEEVFADIGDEQSIEQNLSTFSSHMTHIVQILEQADINSLVLFDELCAGTDPDEGAALAMSILENLRERGIRTMATTHYSELKLYALSTNEVENACCEFSVETLSPTYRLLIGIPGKSNAFAISKKLGLSQEMIDDAGQRLSQESVRFEDVMADLEQSRKTIEQEQLEIEKYKKTIADMEARIQKREEKLAASREKILADANEEAALILLEAKELADKTIKNFRKYGRNADMSAMERDREKVRKELDKANQNKGAKQQKPVKNTKVPDRDKLRIGDPVKVLSMNLKGTVHTLPDRKGNLTVQLGILQYRVSIEDIVLLEEEHSGTIMKQGTSMGSLKMEKSADVSSEIKLIGMTRDEAIRVLDKYLDDAYLAHLKSVRVVHGKGSGTLRKAVHEYLRKLKNVSSYHLGEYGEGDTGVTIVEFK